jgi:hypothetical protein
LPPIPTQSDNTFILLFPVRRTAPESQRLAASIECYQSYDRKKAINEAEGAALLPFMR